MTRTGTLIAAALLAVLAVSPILAKDELELPKDLPPYGADRPLVVPEAVEAVLANGLKVWVVPRAGFPMAVARLTVRGGTAADPAGMGGMSGVLGEVLKGGTATRSSRDVAEELQGVGAELAVEVGEDSVSVEVSGLSTGLATMLGVLVDVVRNPAFPAGEVELAKANAAQNLLAQEATPELEVDKAFAVAVFGDHPYHIVAPDLATLEAITPTLLRAEHARRFRPEGALLVVVGAVAPQPTIDAAARLFGDWKGRGEPPAATPPAPAEVERQILVLDRPGSIQSEIRVGRPTVPARDPDHFPLLVANTVFGGAFTSRLTENIREDKGYTYTPGSSADTYRQGGLLGVSAAVRTEVTGAALLEIFYELDRMGVTDVSAEELARARRYQSGLFVLTNQINGAVAATLAGNWVEGLPRTAIAEFVPRVNAVTAEQVRAAGRRFLSSRSQVVVIGGDAGAVVPQVEQFGRVARRDVPAEPQ